MKQQTVKQIDKAIRKFEAIQKKLAEEQLAKELEKELQLLY